MQKNLQKPQHLKTPHHSHTKHEVKFKTSKSQRRKKKTLPQTHTNHQPWNPRWEKQKKKKTPRTTCQNSSLHAGTPTPKPPAHPGLLGKEQHRGGDTKDRNERTWGGTRRTNINTDICCQLSRLWRRDRHWGSWQVPHLYFKANTSIGRGQKSQLWIVTGVIGFVQTMAGAAAAASEASEETSPMLHKGQSKHYYMEHWFLWFNHTALRAISSSSAPGAAEDAHPNSPSSEGPEISTCLDQKRTKEETLLEAVNEWEEQPDKLQIDAICGSSASGWTQNTMYSSKLFSQAPSAISCVPSEPRDWGQSSPSAVFGFIQTSLSLVFF